MYKAWGLSHGFLFTRVSKADVLPFRTKYGHEIPQSSDMPQTQGRRQSLTGK